MLAHPTLDQLNSLGLYGLAKDSRNSNTNQKLAVSNTPNGSGCCSNTN